MKKNLGILVLYVLLVLVIILLILVFPVLVNAIIKAESPFSNRYFVAAGEPQDWVSFYGGYIGAIIGGLVVYYVARLQIRSQNSENLITRKLERRMYTSLIWLNTDWNFKGHPEINNVRVILTEEFQRATRQIQVREDYLKQIHMGLTKERLHLATFAIITPIGDSNIVFNCTVEFFYETPQLIVKVKNDTRTPEVTPSQKFYISTISKGEVVAIPITKSAKVSYLNNEAVIEHDNYDISKIEIIYHTVMNEKIQYIINFENHKETYALMLPNGKSQLLFESMIENITWQYPANKLL